MSAPALRHLVYNYTSNVRSDSEFHYGGIGTGAPGVGTSWSAGTDKGTITVDVVAVANDGGLVIRISEKSSTDRARFVDPVMCAVYGNTHVECSANSSIDPEMYQLLRILGRNFVDTGNLDQKNHWQLQTGGKRGLKETTDFTIVSNQNGLARITENIEVRDQDAASGNEHTEGTIVYDTAMSVPKSLHEETMLHPSTSQTVERTIDVQLQTDSFAH
ncbi:MAG TPA: hypothetical protein VJP85_05350 [Candidatus Baltobacteraceae bacterium]|nr:hypothetical protein [Candidatus Baltobacteraceae bacterium]